jgi:hypothetical protein
MALKQSASHSSCSRNSLAQSSDNSAPSASRMSRVPAAGLYIVMLVTAVLLIAGCSHKNGSSAEGVPPSSAAERTATDISRPNERSPQSEDVDKITDQIGREGVASVPGLAPNEQDPRSVFYSKSESRSKRTVVSKVFSVGQNWKIRFVAGPANPAPKESYFVVELFDASNKQGEHGARIIEKQFSTLPMLANDQESDAIIFPKGGTFFLKIRSTVPYSLDVLR